MTVLTHTVKFYVTFGGHNDFVVDGDYIVSDNTISVANNEVRTIDTITRSPTSNEYLPVYPLDGTSLKYKWWDYRKEEMWNFNLWNTTSTTLFANQLCQAIYNSMHNKITEWSAVYGSTDYLGVYYPTIDNLNVYIMWGYPLDENKQVMNEVIIVPYFYRGKDPQHSLEISINSTTV